MAFDALVEVKEFLFVHGVGEGEHGDAVVDFLEVFESGAADALGGGVGEAKIGEVFFEGFELAEESVIFGIRDNRSIEDVVAMGVLVEFFSKGRNLLRGFIGCIRIHGSPPEHAERLQRETGMGWASRLSV